MPFSNLFKRPVKSKVPNKKEKKRFTQNDKSEQQRKATRKGEIGEYKIDIQLSQLPKPCKFLGDIMVPNTKSRSGYSQIDHIVITPYGLFVIETKNYQGQIVGKLGEKKWRQNGKFEVYNPFLQNFGHIQALKNHLTAFPDVSYLSMISFTRRCTFKVDPELRKIQSDKLIVYDTELSEFIHRKLTLMPKLGIQPCLSEEGIAEIDAILKKANLTDSKLRQEHIDKAKIIKQKSSLSEAKCAVCNKRVSEKVQSYCMNHKKRFQGKIYCFAHQK